jgi:hypothetical protein
VIDDEALEFGNDLGVPLQRELSVDLLLDHRESELLEPHCFGARELLVAEIGQRLAAEECECLAELP